MGEWESGDVCGRLGVEVRMEEGCCEDIVVEAEEEAVLESWRWPWREEMRSNAEASG